MKQYKVKTAGVVYWDMLLWRLPFGLLVCAKLFGYIPDEWISQSYIVGAILFFVGVFRHIRRFKYLTCESCRERLPVDELREGERITFTCRSCGIIWRTEIYQFND